MKTSIVKYEHDILIKGKDITPGEFDTLIGLNNLHKNKYFTVEPRGIRFKHYVGAIQINNKIVEIRPKADRSDKDTKWQNVLTDMLKACGRIKIHTSAEANLSRSRLNLLELYFDQYLTEVQILLRKGLIKQYRRESGNVKALKGKLDFAQNIRHNLVHKERFYTSHQVYDTNHTIHQVLFHAIEIVHQFSSSMWISDKCKRVQLGFPEVTKIKVTKQLLDSIQLTRKTAVYTRSLELARLIILNYSPNISQGKDKMISILFNMNQLWEEYILLKLRQATLNHPEINILGKRVKSFWGSNRLEPDIVIEKENKTYIIDTKWKISEKSTSVQDLRQIYAYGRFWNAHKTMLLHPGSKKNNGFVAFNNIEHIKLEDVFYEQQHECMKGFVSVLKPSSENYVLDNHLGRTILELFGLISSSEQQ